MPPPTVQVKLWHHIVQPSRPVALFRLCGKMQSGGTIAIQLNCAALSAELHKQKPDTEDTEVVENWTCCGAYFCQHTPESFKLVRAKELVVPRMEVSQRWLEEQDNGNNEKKARNADAVSLGTIISQYRDEHVWWRWIDNLLDDGDGEGTRRSG
ncbi:hypothetical protein VTI74DRAFT_8940 [Chaetomium olivicolor]